MRLAVLVPTYNEIKNIEGVVRAVIDCVPKADVYVIDDNSPDGTARVVEGIASDFPQVKLLKRSSKLGLASAYLDTMTDLLPMGLYDLFLTIDADLSHNPRYIPEMLRRIETCDLVIGSRYTQGGSTKNWPLRRVLLSYLGNLYVHTLLRTPFRDATAGFMMMRIEFLKKLDLQKVSASGYAFLIELKYYFQRQGARISEVPIVFTDREHGQSKISSSVVKEGLLMPWRLLWFRKKYLSEKL